jgi:phosphoglycerate dehydrogenase-like enzyme
MKAPKLSWSDLAGARVGVWGLGRDGQASLRKLRELGVEPVLVDDQPPAAAGGAPADRPVLATADGWASRWWAAWACGWPRRTCGASCA